MRKILFLCCICLLSITNILSQDEHFTRYDFTPTFFNPANTGNFYGSYRIGVLYREQARTWFKAEDQGSINPDTNQPFFKPVSSTYTTPTLFIDANFGLGFSAGDWSSFGLTMLSDKSGDGALSNSSYMLNAAYHWSLNKKGGNVLTIGAQYGRNSIAVDGNNLNTETEFLNQVLDPLQLGVDGKSEFNTSYSDVNVGVTLVSKIGKTSKLELGAAVGHLLPSSFEIQNDSIANIENNIDPRINVNARLRFLATDGIALEPVIYYSTAGGASNLQIQFNSTFRLNENSAFTAGLGYRLGDAAQILVGMNYDLWKVGIGYDMTVSSAADANSSVGGYELGISRIIFRNKKPQIDPILLCPKL